MAIIFPGSQVYDVFNQYVLGIERDVILIYPEAKLPCDNCYLESYGNKTRSVSIYKAGGPIPFERGMPCPYCDGKGYKAVEQTETIRTRIYNDSKNWNNKTVALKLPQGSIQLITRFEYVEKIKRAKFLIPEYNGLETIQNERFERSTEIYSDSFVLNPQKYVTSYWVKNNEASI